MTTRTGATLDDFNATERSEPLSRGRHTYCHVDQVENPALRSVMSTFDENLFAPMQPYSRFLSICQGLRTVPRFILVPIPSPTPVPEPSPHTFDDVDVVVMVCNLQRRLGIDLKDVLAAANIKRRTYHSWAQPNAPRPRLASQGRLWALAQLVDDLTEILDVPIRQWLLAGSARLRALRAGCFDELLEQASQECMQQDSTGTAAGPFHGVGDDHPPSLHTTGRELVIDQRAITEPGLPPRESPEAPQI